MEKDKSPIQIFATDENGGRLEVTDLYWFEEEGLHDFDGRGSHGQKYTFDIYISGNWRMRLENEIWQIELTIP